MKDDAPIGARTEQGISASLRPITGRYLIAVGLPLYVDARGRRYLEDLWVKDLLEHLEYIKNLTLVSPCRHEGPPADAVPVDTEPAFANVRFVNLRAPSGKIDGLRHLPATIVRLWKAVGQADIVHTGPAAWPLPIPEVWLLHLFSRLRKRFSFIIIESAFWRLVPDSPGSLTRRIRSWESSVTERGNRWCVNHADLAIFTQDQYRRSLLTRDPQAGYVINASWIDEQVIVSDADVSEMWRLKLLHHDGVLRVLFVGRLARSKGIKVLLDAVDLLSAQGIAIELGILGRGPLLEECERASATSLPPVRIRLLGRVPHGPEFFALLREYHAIVVPSITDEQPRVLYDAFSQGIPVLASDTCGIRDCVHDGETGKLVPVNDPMALADVLKWASRNPEELAELGRTCLGTARGLTHREMHRRRWQVLLNTLDESLIAGPGVSA